MMSRRDLKALFCGVAVLGIADIASLGGAAAESEASTVSGIEAPPPVVEYVIVDQDVSNFLTQLARDAGVRLLVSNEVTGRINDLHVKGELWDVIEIIANGQDLDWFVFNGTVNVSSRGEAKTRVIRLGDLPVGRVQAALEKAGLQPERFGLRDTAQGSAISLSGPPRFLAIAEAIIETIPNAAPPELAPVRMVRMRRGNVMTLEPIVGGFVSADQSGSSAPSAEGGDGVASDNGAPES